MKILTGIASTTHVDAQNEAFAKEALDSAVEQVRARLIPFLLNHDPDQQLGVILCARVEQLEDGEFGLLVVVCVFESDEEAQRHPNGAPNTVWRDYTHYLDEPLDQKTEPGEGDAWTPRPMADPNNMAEMLEAHLDSTSVWRDGRVYKVKHLIAKTGDLEIQVYRDHPPPHFHVYSKQRHIDVRFHLATLEPLNASISTRDVKKIQDYFRTHPDDLITLRAEHERMQQ